MLRRCFVTATALLVGCRGGSDKTNATPSVVSTGSAASTATPPTTLPASSSDAATSAPLMPLGKGIAWARAERKDAEGRNTVWVVLRVALGDAHLAIVEPSHGRLEQLAKEPTFVAAVNGGFFEADGSPSGLLMAHGRRMGAFDARGGSGVLVVDRGRARLLPADDDAKNLQGDIVLQCGPRLVEADGTIGILRDDGKRASRTVACIRDGGRELDFVMAWTRNSDRDGPGLLEMAKALAAPLVAGDATGCEAALNLDGGPSTGLVLRDRPDEMHTGPTGASRSQSRSATVRHLLLCARECARETGMLHDATMVAPPRPHPGDAHFRCAFHGPRSFLMPLGRWSAITPREMIERGFVSSVKHD